MHKIDPKPVVRLAVGRVRYPGEKAIDGRAQVSFGIGEKSCAFEAAGKNYIAAHISRVATDRFLPIRFGCPGCVPVLVEVLANVEKFVY